MNWYDDDGDDYLLESLRQGDPSAWDMLVERHASDTYSVVRTYAIDPDDAVQETFIRTFTLLQDKSRSPQLNAGGLPAWLRGVARYCATTFNRREARRPVRLTADMGFYNLMDPSPSPDEFAEEAELDEILHDALNTLDLPVRLSVSQRFLEGRTLKGIAESKRPTGPCLTWG